MKTSEVKPMAALAAALLAGLSVPSQAQTTHIGMTLNGGIQTVWSSDLGPRASQSLHPTSGGTGSISPITPDNHLFLDEPLNASLSALGLLGIVNITGPGHIGLDGRQTFHLQATLSTPAVGYYGLGIGADIGGVIYVTGGPSNQLYYGLQVDIGASNGGGSGYSDLLQTNFNNSWGLDTTSTAQSTTHFGVTTVNVWRGGSIVAAPDGGGFVSFYFQPSIMHGSGGTGPGETVTYNFELALSPTPFSVMPGVPEPGTWALMLAGCGVLAGISRRRMAT